MSCYCSLYIRSLSTLKDRSRVKSDAGKKKGKFFFSSFFFWLTKTKVKQYKEKKRQPFSDAAKPDSDFEIKSEKPFALKKGTHLIRGFHRHKFRSRKHATWSGRSRYCVLRVTGGESHNLQEKRQGKEREREGDRGDYKEEHLPLPVLSTRCLIIFIFQSLEVMP